MSSISLGDMASTLRTMRFTTQVKQDLERYTSELSSGRKQNIAAAVSGDFTPLSSIERSLRTLASYDLSIREADLFATSMQTTLGTIASHLSDSATGLLTAAANGGETSISVAAGDAQSRFRSILSALNTRVGDRALFSGAATGATAFAPADDILADLQAVVASATTVSDVETLLDDWFMVSGGGFETTAYRGSTRHLSGFTLGDGESASLEVRGDDPALRQVLKGLALASLLDQGLFDGDPDARAQLLRSAGETLMGAQAGLTDLQAQVGSVEARIEEAGAANASMKYSYSRAKSDIVSADPEDTASLLQQTETQLELIYTLTARLSRLTLADYL
ncbi:flagellin [Celeribacter indicus]|uniref:Flagellar hook-associated protein FlgL n=1 Tax=Celeribacter indicus TaxID=1208324 RepID=A0A0B5DVN7_9RHOB|nr:flagellin [Celeribacter indicus]AJE44831.1 flagellar hook-associated protein FlgL [Celeribacter indicus]SDX24036.1 flagellar hook-associated protein 3 FlgL [Celeribacter indicus]